MRATRPSRKAALGAALAFIVVALEGCWPFAPPATTTTTTRTTTTMTTTTRYTGPPTTITTTTTTTTTLDCTSEGGHYCLPHHCVVGRCLKCSAHYGINEKTGQCMQWCGGQWTEPQEPPKANPDPTHHKAVEWPQICIDNREPPYRFLGIGDWGGVIAWPEGTYIDKPGSTRPLDYGGVWNHTGKYRGGRRYKPPADEYPQRLVASCMKKVLQENGAVDFVLNAGDNFYAGGLDYACGGTAQDMALTDSSKQFHFLFEEIYGEIAKVPWLSVLGNHDMGGLSYDNAWDGQIFRTWVDNGATWRMPAPWWSQRVRYRDFSVMFYMLDSNTFDALPKGIEPNHNICAKKRPVDCWGIDEKDCFRFFQKWWSESLKMMEEGMEKNPAEWHIIVTHFPPDNFVKNPKIVSLHQKYGIDFIFTGHTHLQEYNVWNGIPGVISGGGGGITSDAPPSADGMDNAYGFCEFLIDKDNLKVNLLTWGGPEPSKLIYWRKHTVQRAPRNGDVETVMKFAEARRKQLEEEKKLFAASNTREVDEHTKAVIEADLVKYSHAFTPVNV